MFEDINETANELASAVSELEDPNEIASVIADALVIERERHTPNADLVVPLLAFLFYLREEKGATYMYGGHKLEEAFNTACTLSRVDKRKVIDSFRGLSFD